MSRGLAWRHCADYLASALEAALDNAELSDETAQIARVALFNFAEVKRRELSLVGHGTVADAFIVASKMCALAIEEKVLTELPEGSEEALFCAEALSTFELEMLRDPSATNVTTMPQD
jgi:hypothetical protein